MTPFGRRLREFRAERGITQKEMATALGVSAAYLSALENGHRGAPSWNFVQRVIGYLNIIWDDAEELQSLARRSHPRIAIDTSALAPEATELSNLLAERIADLSRSDLTEIIHEIRSRLARAR